MLKKILSITALALIAIALVGCKGIKDLRSSLEGEGQESIDTTKSQIYIGLGTNGINDWLDYQIAQFEEAYADVSFEEGKKGVQVYYSFDEKFKNWDTMPGQYSKYTQKLIITESIPYQTVKRMALDITDTVNEALNINSITGKTEGNETQSISDKLLSQFADYYGDGGKYYALPTQEVQQGLVYDIDLFNEYGLYFAKSDSENKYEYVCNNVYTGEESTYYFTDMGLEWTEEDLECGPDGKYGTYDDGLPRTYEEFFALCDYMYREFMIMPLCWAGKVQAYMTGFIETLVADYHGEEYNLKNNFNGTAHDCVVFDENGKIVFNEDGTVKTEDIEINEKNGYELVKQVGAYYALEFLETLLKSDYYEYAQCFGGTIDHLSTQRTYLQSRSTAVNKPIAMMAEGSWWQGEASGKFEDMASTYGEEWSMQNRNFGFLPLPKYSMEQVGEKQDTYMSLEMVVFLTNDIPESQQPMYKLFLKSMFRREAILDFLRITGSMRPYELDLTDAEYNTLTGFGKSSYNTSKYTNILFAQSYNEIYNANQSLFNSSQGFHWQNQEGGIPSSNMDPKLSNSYNAVRYFESIWGNWNQTKWDNLFKSYYKN